MIVKVTNDNSLDFQAWFAEITDAFKNSGNADIENIVIDTLEAYYAHIEDIARLGGRYLRMPVDEDFLVINNNTREISVKNTSFMKNGIAIEADHLAEIVYFKVDRYFDRMDLSNSKMNIEIRWSLLNAKRQVVNYGANKAIFIDTESFPGEVVFGWAITREMCSEAGSLSFSVCFYIGNNNATNETSLRDYSLNTQIASLPVKAGIGIKNVEQVPDDDMSIIKSLFNSVYTDKNVTPLDQPVFSYLSWEHDNIPDDYLYPFDATLVQYKIANLGNEEQWDAPVELYASAYCPGATSMSYSGSFLDEKADKDTESTPLVASPKYIEMKPEIAEVDLTINNTYGDTGAVYVKKEGSGWSDTPMSLTEVKEYFAQINAIRDTTPETPFEYGSVAKRYMAINADKVGIYRFNATGSKTVDVDGKPITVTSKEGQSSGVIIPPACQPIANNLVINVEGEIDTRNIEIIDKDNTDYIYVSAKDSKITSVRTNGLGILVGTQPIGTDSPTEVSIAKGHKPVEDYAIFAGEFALVINDGKSDEELGEDNLFVKLKNGNFTTADLEGLEFKKVADYKSDENYSGEYGIMFEAGHEIAITENGVKVEGFAIHRKNGTYKISKLLEADKIATPAAYSLKATNDDGASALAVEYALENKGVFDAYKAVSASEDAIEGFEGKIYNTASANRNQGIQLKAVYDGDVNPDFKLRWFYGSTPLEATQMKKEYTDGANGGLVKVEQSGKESVLKIDGAVDTGVVTYLMVRGENEFNNTVSKCSFDNMIIAIGESGL